MKRKWICVAALLGAIWNLAGEPTTSFRPANKFLLVVETSAASSKLEYGGRQAVVELLYTGVYGQMRDGDTFGMWTFNESVYAGFFPMQTWKADASRELAANAGQFLRKQPYEKVTRLSVALKQVAGLLRTVKDLNVFIVSDPGNEPEDSPVGSGYASAYQQRASEARVKKKPLITTLTARNGSISNWIVTVAGEPIRLPVFAIPEPVIVKQEPVRPPPVPRTPHAPIIMKRPGEVAAAPDGSVGLGKMISGSYDVTYVSTFQTNQAALDPAPPTPAASTQPPPSNPQTPPHPAPTVQPVAHVATANSYAPSAPKAEPNKTRVTETAPQPPAPKPETTVKVAARERTVDPAVTASEPQETSPNYQAVATALKPKAKAPEITGSSDKADAKPAEKDASTDRVFSPTAMIVVGGLLLALATTVTWIFIQHLRRSSSPSFISRSMQRP